MLNVYILLCSLVDYTSKKFGNEHLTSKMLNFLCSNYCDVSQVEH